MRKVFFTILFLLAAFWVNAQQSLLVNFGSSNCVNPAQPSFSLIKNPLGVSPSVLTQCSMASQLPSFFAVFIAYNPKDNNIYVSDVRNFAQSRIWRLNVGLPEAIGCPASIPATPTFTHSYVSNNFEFDNNGDLWSFSNFDALNGRCNLDKFDVVTGNIINTRVLQFPPGNFPNAITSGDLCILPNGRMFATLGEFPSRLFEIENYTAPGIISQAKFLITMPKNCYGIAYLNGLLEITGTDLNSSCYYYTYDFTSQTLGAEKPFQNGQGPIDNTSITPTIGATKRLAAATKINANTADITYEIYVRNMGNTILNDINVTEDLGAVFGEANLSNVAVSFVPGANAALLQLNPAFNGTTVTQLFKPAQSLSNFTGFNENYYCKIQISCRVTNLVANKVYNNSAIATAAINNIVDKVNIVDSSNNGLQNAVDPNNNGNPTEAGENIPTPFNISLLPVKFLGFEGRLNKPNLTELLWRIAVPASGADFFEVQWSTDASQWKKAGTLIISNPMQPGYSFLHDHSAPPVIFYRLKQVDKDGVFIYSPVIKLQQANGESISLGPNPANDRVTVVVPRRFQGSVRLSLFDAAGKKLFEQICTGATTTFSVKHFPSGMYRVLLTNGTFAENRPLVITR